MSKLPIPREVLAQHTAILGKTRSGKSSVMRLLVEDLLERKQPVCIVDPKGDWWGIKLAADGKGPGYPVVIFGGEHADIPINETTGAQVAELFATGNRPCLIDLGGWMVGPRTRFWIDFASILFKLTKGERWLAVDEFHNFAPKGKVESPDVGKMLHWSNRLASEGLGKGLAMLFASQRPQKVHNDSLTSAETLIAMRVLHPSDRNAVSDWIKGCGDYDGSQVLNSLAQMERGEGWAWSPEIGLGPKRVKFPLFTTYDSFRAQTVADAKRLTGWADVDIDDVKAKFAATIEKAKADDPKELRRRIQELERELRQKPAATLARVEAKVKEVPVLQEGQLRLLKVQAELLGKVAGDFQQRADRVQQTADTILAAVRRVENNRTGNSDSRPAIKQPTGYKKAERLSGSVPAFKAAAVNGDIPAVAQRILNALAELEQLGADTPERTLVAFLAGYTHLQSKGFVNAMSALSSAGYITYPDSGRAQLTPAGQGVAGYPTAPRSPSEVQDRVIKLLGGKSAEILRPLIEAYPDGMERTDLAAAAGYGHLQSKGFVNALSRLSSLGFVKYVSKGGPAVAAPVLFLEDR